MQNNKSLDKIAIIDGYSIIFKAYFASPSLTRKDGLQIGALYGFINILLKIIAKLNITHIAMAFDTKGNNFRHEIYPKYKENRPECPKDLIPQFDLIRESVKAFNIKIFEADNFEADDIIATLNNRLKNQFKQIVIISPDKDLMQLISYKTFLYDISKNKIIDNQAVIDKFDINANHILDFLSLTGDSADNVPGVKGIGPKTASKLINEYQNIENIFNNIGEIENKRHRELLIQDKDKAFLSKKLISLDEYMDLDFNIDELSINQIDPYTLLKFLQKQDFKSLIKKLSKAFNININQENNNNLYNKDFNINNYLKKSKIINIDNFSNEEDIKKIINEAIFIIKSKKSVIFDSNFNNDKIINISFAIYDKDNISHIFCSNDCKNIKLILDKLKIIFANNDIRKIAYRINDQAFILKDQYDINYNNIDDIVTMSYILKGEKKNYHLRELIDENLSIDMEDYKIDDKNIFTIFNDLELDNDIDYQIDNQIFYIKIILIYELYKELLNNLSTGNLLNIYKNIEKKITSLIINMQNNGILLDVKILSDLSDEIKIKIDEISKYIYEIAGEEFNINSVKQLAHILFEKLSLPYPKKTKNNNYSTNIEILEYLEMSGYEIATYLIKLRHYNKIKNTYLDKLPNFVNKKDNRLYSRFSNISTSTGRLSSFDPNIQQIPVRTYEGHIIRSAFKAKENYKFLSYDYSQIELRIIAKIANVKNLLKSFEKDDTDIHKITASEIFNIDIDEVTSDMRRSAKAINFGIIYKISPFGLAKQLKINQKLCKEYIDRYFRLYPEIKLYFDKSIEFAEKHGYVNNLFGRRCYIRGINSNNHITKSFAIRSSVNAPIQSTAADIIKIAMIKIDEKIKNYDIKLISQIHDELIFEAHNDIIDKMKDLIKYEMINIDMLDMKLLVNSKISNSL